MKKIKLYLLTGYLGAGKTTFLKGLLEDTDLKIGIIMNEFGKVGIDGSLIKDKSSELIEINRGSIFCSCLQLSFVESLKDMSENPIDVLFVEGSGLADPSNIKEILEATEVLIGEKYEYSGSICLVDALNFKEQLNEHETLKKQLVHSHLAVVSKDDLAENYESIKEQVLKINSDIEVVKSNFGKLPFDFLNDWEKDIVLIEDETGNTVENKPKTLSLEMYEPVSKEKLIEFLNSIEDDAYRIKGFFTDLDDNYYQVDVVNGTIDMVISELDNPTEIVIISKIGPMIIKKIIPNWNDIVSTEFKLKN